MILVNFLIKYTESGSDNRDWGLGALRDWGLGALGGDFYPSFQICCYLVLISYCLDMGISQHFLGICRHFYNKNNYFFN